MRRNKFPIIKLNAVKHSEYDEFNILRYKKTNGINLI